MELECTPLMILHWCVTHECKVWPTSIKLQYNICNIGQNVRICMHTFIFNCAQYYQCNITLYVTYYFHLNVSPSFSPIML